jgi:hypothetical protein
MTPSNEEFKKLVELANQLVWKKPDLDILAPRTDGQEYPVIATTLQEMLKFYEAQGKLFLPDLRALNNKHVAIFSDYAGESTGKYHTYSILICAWDALGPLRLQMEQIREHHRLGKKEIAFKEFSKGQVRRALPDFLHAADSVLGFLCTLVISKELRSVFGIPNRATQEELSKILREAGLGNWKREVAEKLLRVVHLTAFLTALLAHDGQQLFWMTDNDAICPNQEAHQRALVLFQRVLGIYGRPNVKFPLVGGALPFKERAIEFMDSLSVTDVTASSVEHYLTQKDLHGKKEFVVKQGAEAVLQWLARDGIGLKKGTFILLPAANGAISRGALEFKLVKPPENVSFVPIYM